MALTPSEKLPFKMPDFLIWLGDHSQPTAYEQFKDLTEGHHGFKWRILEGVATMPEGSEYEGYTVTIRYEDASELECFLAFVDDEFVTLCRMDETVERCDAIQ